MTLMERRRALMGSGVEFSIPYIQDGLVHYWDAEQNTRSGHSGNSSIWEDLVGSVDLSVKLSSAISWGKNHLKTVSAPGVCADASALDSVTDSTVEICVTPTSTATASILVVSSGGNNSARIAVFSDNTVGVTTARANSYKNTASSITSIRGISARYGSDFTLFRACYINGGVAAQGSASHSFAYSGSKRVWIGNTGSSGQFPLSAKIYAIRIYNRHLSAEEIAQNYATDMQRFGL